MPAGPPPRPPRPPPSAPPGAPSAPVAAGRSFIIEYEDAAGRSRLRPVTVWSVRTGADGVPILVAHSHDSQALRSFRLDRIKAVTDFDGVVQEPLIDFFQEVLGLAWPASGAEPGHARLAADRWTVIRKVVRDGGLVLLVAMASADSDVSAEEVAVILDHAIRSCAAEGITLTDAERQRLHRSITRTRPSPETTEKAVAALARTGREAIAAVLDACRDVADADGFRHHREMTLLNTFSFALTGTRLLDPP